MTEIIEIKRKEFVVIEKLGEHSYKVERKGKFFFLKKYEKKEDFQKFVDRQHRLKITAIDIPKVYLFDKNQMISVVDFIEGPTVFEMLLKEDIKDELIYKTLLSEEWYGRREKIRLDFMPENFKFYHGKLYYLPFTYNGFESNYNFINKDFRYWFPTKEFANYVRSKGLEFDNSRVGNEYATNKQMALIAVKYYM